MGARVWPNINKIHAPVLKKYDVRPPKFSAEVILLPPSKE